MNVIDTKNDLQFLFDLHRNMVEHKLILVYEGEISQGITNTLLSLTEKKMELSGVDVVIKRKIFNVMVECLQNISKHSNKLVMDEKYQSAIFMIGKDGESYFIHTGNVLTLESAEILKGKLVHISKLDQEGLKLFYKDMLRNGKISDRGGAGLGLIDIARKSGGKLFFDFQHVEGDFWFYSLQVKISANN